MSLGLALLIVTALLLGPAAYFFFLRDRYGEYMTRVLRANGRATWAEKWTQEYGRRFAVCWATIWLCAALVAAIGALVAGIAGVTLPDYRVD